MSRYPDLAKVLKRMRLTSKLTQLQVADACGFSTAQFISNWERGVSKPSEDCLARLAVAYKVRPALLVDLIMDSEARIIERERRELKARLTPHKNREIKG